MIITPDDRILFIGDSITDTNRNREDAKDLGRNGYCALVSSQISKELCAPELVIFNRGINGYKAIDLLNRFEKDVLALEPTLISILVGINDAGNEAKENSSTSQFELNMKTYLSQIRDQVSTQLVLIEPFVSPVLRPELRAYLNPKIDIIRALALEFGTELIPMDGLFAEASTRAPASFWLYDGVHPTLAGHALIAEAWLDRAEFEI